MMKKYKVAFIGTGGRSVCYASAYADNEEIEVVALADPAGENRKTMAAKAGLPGGHAEYDDWRIMLREHQDLDGVVISTPNFLHAEQAMPCLERGLAVALEKPLATTIEDCERILAAERANGGRTLIGFVLRSTPFYGKIRQLIASGAIGRVVSVQADELPGFGVTSIMNRGFWRRHTETSGGAMLEKSCHDMDVLNWLVDSRPVSLNSYGGSLVFNPNPLLPDARDQCEITGCPYHRKPKFSEHEDRGEEIMHEFVREEGRCIYNIDKDTVDTQCVSIQYASGALVNFMLSFNCSGPRAGRNLHAIGQKGRIFGNLHESKVWLHDNVGDETSEFDTSGDGSGHGGGDRMHALELLKMMRDPDYRPTQNARAGHLSAVMCLAADISMTEGRRINFRYGADGKIELS